MASTELTGAENKVRGVYTVAVEMTSGTAKLQLKLGGMSAAQDIPDASWTGNAMVNVSIAGGEVTPVVTGDAKVFMAFIGNSGDL